MNVSRPRSTGSALLQGGFAVEAATYRHRGDAVPGGTVTKADRQRESVEHRKLARLRAAIDDGDQSPDALDFSFSDP